MSLSATETIAITTAIVSTIAAVWQGFLTRSALKLSTETTLLQRRLELASHAYTSLADAGRLSKKLLEKGGSEEEVVRLSTDIREAKDSMNSLSFICGDEFLSIYDEFAEFVTWLYVDTAESDLRGVFHEAPSKIEKLLVSLRLFSQSLIAAKGKT